MLDKQIRIHEPNLYGTVLDIGGGTKRGAVRNVKYGSQHIVLDKDKGTHPDIIGDIEHLPIKSECIHSIKCTEVLEYAAQPEQAISEMYRVLKNTGELMLSVPFNIGIHYDGDMMRFTRFKLEEMFERHGFRIAVMIEQGHYFTCLGYMLKQAVLNTKSRARWLLYWTFPLIDLTTVLDNFKFVRDSQYLSSWTTGYFITAIKCQRNHEK
jgi:SAM-dependent methyltransferase